MAKDEKKAAATPQGKPPVYVVAHGISTNGKYGIITEDVEVTPQDFDFGQKDFDELVGRGIIVVRPEESAAQEPVKPDGEV